MTLLMRLRNVCERRAADGDKIEPLSVYQSLTVRYVASN